MLRTRIIPTLLLRDSSLVKTVKFDKFQYIGDPVNTCRIFNELEVDELCFLDITASRENRPLNLDILKEISNECFMPISYGGGIDSFKKAEEVFKIGFEKVVINSASFINPRLITEIAKIFGSQAVVVSVDVKKSICGNRSKRFKYLIKIGIHIGVGRHVDGQYWIFPLSLEQNNKLERWSVSIRLISSGMVLLKLLNPASI